MACATDLLHDSFHFFYSRWYLTLCRQHQQGKVYIIKKLWLEALFRANTFCLLLLLFYGSWVLLFSVIKVFEISFDREKIQRLWSDNLLNMAKYFLHFSPHTSRDSSLTKSRPLSIFKLFHLISIPPYSPDASFSL